MQVRPDDLPRGVDPPKRAEHRFGERRVDGCVHAVFPNKPMKPLQCFPKKEAPVLTHDMAEIVDPESDRTIGARIVEENDVAVLVAHEGVIPLVVAARTDDLPGVVNGGYARAVVVEYIGYVPVAVNLRCLLFFSAVLCIAVKIVFIHLSMFVYTV